ncbi:MAG: hypothetical protein N5P05_000453 [Chroococcopsis gigantea SAG 12.99]|nr:hypothetical protein [Chroococcopsis gigantea SAG 12.99]
MPFLTNSDPVQVDLLTMVQDLSLNRLLLLDSDFNHCRADCCKKVFDNRI